jgi:hypothetical protein
MRVATLSAAAFQSKNYSRSGIFYYRLHLKKIERA